MTHRFQVAAVAGTWFVVPELSVTLLQLGGGEVAQSGNRFVDNQAHSGSLVDHVEGL